MDTSSLTMVTVVWFTDLVYRVNVLSVGTVGSLDSSSYKFEALQQPEAHPA